MRPRDAAWTSCSAAGNRAADLWNRRRAVSTAHYASAIKLRTAYLTTSATEWQSSFLIRLMR